MLNKTEQFGQTSTSVQSPSKTWLYFLVPFNVLTEHLLGSSLGKRLLPWQPDQKHLSNDLLYCHIFSRDLPGACVLTGLQSAEWTGICHQLWTSSVIQCPVMAFRRLRQLDCNLKNNIFFNLIKYTSIYLNDEFKCIKGQSSYIP